MEIQIKTGLSLGLDVLLINIKMLMFTQGPAGMFTDKYLTVLAICVTSWCRQLCDHEGWVCSHSACSVRQVFPGCLHAISKPVSQSGSRSCSAPCLCFKPVDPVPFQVKPVLQETAPQEHNCTDVTLERRSSTYLIPCCCPLTAQNSREIFDTSSCLCVDSQGCQRLCTPVV